MLTGGTTDPAPWFGVAGGTPQAGVLLCPLNSQARTCSPCIPPCLHARERNEPMPMIPTTTIPELSIGGHQRRMLVFGQGGWDGTSLLQTGLLVDLLCLPVGDQL